jgi:hypothetical protein
VHLVPQFPDGGLRLMTQLGQVGSSLLAKLFQSSVESGEVRVVQLALRLQVVHPGHEIAPCVLTQRLVQLV